jgi:hypothetical protein
LDSLGVFNCAQIEDAFAVCAWKPQFAFAAAGGDQNSVIWDDFVAFEANLFVFRFEPYHGSAEHEVDSEALVFAARRDKCVFEWFGAPQKSFR